MVTTGSLSTLRASHTISPSFSPGPFEAAAVNKMFVSVRPRSGVFGALNKDGDEKCLLLWLFDVKGSTEFIRNAARHHQSLCQRPGSQSNTGWCPVTVPPCAVAHAGTWSHSGRAKAPVCAQGWKGGHHPRFRGWKGGHHPHFRCHPSPHTPPNCCHTVAAVVDMVPAQSHLYPSHNAPLPSRVIQGKRGTGCKLHVRTQGCKEGCGMSRLLPPSPAGTSRCSRRMQHFIIIL